ncbi:MAG TPA: hypothetical protein VGK29_05055 [Paludibaculum sp.]|jgi:hypothetical protein
MIEISSTERVLVLSLANTTGLRELARGAALVGVGTGEYVRAARRELSDLDNVMFVTGSREEIPWQDHWFTLIVDAEGGPVTGAMQRALAEGGRIETGA